MPSFSKTAEISAIATSTLGAISTVITQQAVYVVAPMSVALSLRALNRHRLEQQFKQKPIGTHEKILVCDRTFAMISTHNFLTSDQRS